MRRYVFNLGNGTTGPIGYVTVVRARNKQEAIAKLRAALPETFEIVVDQGGVEQIIVYFNPDVIRQSHGHVGNEADDEEDSQLIDHD